MATQRNERIAIEVTDKVASSVGVKIRSIAEQARKAYEQLNKMQGALNGLGAGGSANKLAAAADKNTAAMQKQALAAEKLNAAQSRSTASAARAEAAQSRASAANSRAAESAAKLAITQERLATQQARTAAATAQAGAAQDRQAITAARAAQAQANAAVAQTKVATSANQLLKSVSQVTTEQNRAAESANRLKTSQETLTAAQSKTAAAMINTSTAQQRYIAQSNAAATSAIKQQTAQQGLATAQARAAAATQAAANQQVIANNNIAASQARAQLAAQRLANAQTTVARTTNNVQRSLTSGGLTWKMYENSMRGVPAQITDIVVSLQGGQAPLTVLLQQGGQLKDMFGGVVPAMKALATQFLKMLGPGTLLIGAIVALGAAYYQGSKELDAYNRALIMTGNRVGVTTSQITQMARNIDGVAGTQRNAAAALAEMATTANVTSANLERFSLIAVRLQKDVGQSVEETAKQFAKLAEDPVEASAKLNKEYNYLTIAVYKQIKALQDQGRATEAAELAQNTFAEAMEKRANEMQSNLGYIERAWRGVKSAAAEAWDAMLNVGRKDTAADQLGKLEKELARRQTGSDSWKFNDAAGQKGKAALTAQIEALKESMRLEQKAADAKAAAARQTEAAIKWEEDGVKFLKDKEKLQRDINRARNEGLAAGKTEAEIAARVASIQAEYDKKQKPDSAAKKELTTFQQLIAAIETKIATNEEELKFANNVTESMKLRLKLEQELAANAKSLSPAHKQEAMDALARLATTEREAEARKQSVVNAQHFYEVQNELNQAAVEESKAREAGQKALNEYLRAIDEAGGLVDAEIAGIGRNAQARQLLIDKYQAELKLRKEIEAINKNEGLKTPEARQSEIDRATNGKDKEIFDKSMEAAAKRLSEYLDPDRAEDFGDALQDAFSGALSPLKKMTESLARFAKEQKKVTQAQTDLTDLVFGGKMNNEGAIKRQAEIDQESLKSTLGIFGDLTGAAASFFDESSDGYKTLQVVSAAFHAAELAMTTMELVPKAISAVLGQAQGEPYTAFARMAAMAAFVASLGVSIGGMSGGGGGGGGYEGIKKGGTGTVLGMEGEQSESIANSMEILADNSKIELAYTQKMLSVMTQMKEGIMGLAGQASTDFFIRGFAGASFGDSFLDSGIGFLPGQSVADIIAKGVQGFGFNLIFDKGAQAMWKSLDAEFSNGVGAILKNVADVVFTAADALGLNDAALAERMMSLIPTLGDTSTYQMNGMMGMVGGGLVSLKDMSGKEIQEELEAIFSAVGDQMAAAALPALRPFQRVGEGMFETLIRVTTGIETAEYALEKFGFTAINYADIVRKQGDVAVEIMRQTLLGVEEEMALYAWQGAGTVVSGANRKTGVAKILEDFVGEASELEELYTALMLLRSALKNVGQDAINLSREMIRGAGGMETLQSGLDSYFENFFTEQERLAAKTARLNEEFERIGVSVPKGTDGFRAMVEGIDTSTEAGQYLFGQLMGVANAFYEVANAAGQTGSAADRWKEMQDQFLMPGQIQAQALQRIQSTLAANGENMSFEQIMGFSRAEFANRIQEAFAAGDSAMVELMLNVSEDFLTISKATTDALQEQQTAASETVSALQADVDRWKSMRDQAKDLARSITMSMTGDTGESSLWATLYGNGEIEDRLKAATELKSIIERNAQTQLASYNQQLSAAQSLLALGKQLKAYVDSLKLGALSALTPSEQMAEAVRQYNETLAKARSGDEEAQRNLQNVANSYLTLAQQYDPDAYGAIFNTVTAQLDQFANQLITDAERQISALEGLIARAEAANGLTREQLAKMNELKLAVEKMQAEADVKLVTTNAQLKIATDKLAVIEGLLKAANEVWAFLPQGTHAVETGLSTVVSTLQELPREFARYIAAIVGYNVNDIPGFASGGVHEGGWRVVGEYGKELEYTAPSRIYNNAQTNAMLGGANAELVEEVREMREVLDSVVTAIYETGDRTANASIYGSKQVTQGVEKGLQKARRESNLDKRRTVAKAS